MPDGVELRLIVPPTHAGPSLAAVMPIVLITKVVVFFAVQPEPGAVTTTVYTPAIAVVALVVNVVFWVNAVNESGPLQL